MAERPPILSRGTETVLVAEDEESVRQVVVMILRRQGYTVLTAASGHEALRMWETSRVRIDLLLTDVAMPVMHGMELAYRVRSMDPNARVILMSGYPEDVVRSGESSAMPFSFVQKPIWPADLIAKVREALTAA